MRDEEGGNIPDKLHKNRQNRQRWDTMGYDEKVIKIKDSLRR